MASDCQRHCKQEVEKMIKNIVGKMNGSVESIYFQEEADYKTNLNNDNSKELKHRFLLSFTAPCLRTQPTPTGSQPATSEADTAPVNNSSMNENSSQPPAHDESPAPPNRTTEFYEVPMNHFHGSEGNGFHRVPEDSYLPLQLDAELMMNDQMLIGRGQGEAVAVDMSGVKEDLGMAENNIEANFCSSEGLEYTELTQLTSISGMLFPLSNDDMHAVIDQQLSKNITDPKPMEWGNQLFNDLNSLSTETDKNKLSPQQQSAEVSSSSGTCISASPPYDAGVSPPTSPITTATAATYTEVSESQEYISNVSYPYTSLHQLGNGPMNIIIAGTEILQQEGVAPAKLPAVSSLFSTGTYNNYSWSSTDNRTSTTGPVQQVVQMTKQVQRQTTAISHHALLLPKPRNVSNSVHGQSAMSTLKTRSRKKSPLGRNKEPVVEEPQSMFSDTSSSNAPQGHSYESWILEEGLYKVRKQGLHKTDDKDVYPYACPACAKKYKNPNGIKYHAKYAHGPKSIFLCDICKREYSTRHGLAAHKRTHPQTFSPPRIQIITTSDSSHSSIGSKSNALITSTLAPKKSAVA